MTGKTIAHFAPQTGAASYPTPSDLGYVGAEFISARTNVKPPCVCRDAERFNDSAAPYRLW